MTIKNTCNIFLSMELFTNSKEKLNVTNVG